MPITGTPIRASARTVASPFWPSPRTTAGARAFPLVADMLCLGSDGSGIPDTDQRVEDAGQLLGQASTVEAGDEGRVAASGLMAPIVERPQRRLDPGQVGRIHHRAEAAPGKQLGGDARRGEAEHGLAEVEVLEALGRELLALPRGLRDGAHEEHVALMEVAEALRVRHPADVADALGEAEVLDV